MKDKMMFDERDDSEEIYIWDMPGLRRVELETNFGFKIHYDHALSISVGRNVDVDLLERENRIYDLAGCSGCGQRTLQQNKQWCRRASSLFNME